MDRLSIGQAVQYVDSKGRTRDALLTAIWGDPIVLEDGEEAEVTRDGEAFTVKGPYGPSVNLVLVSEDAEKSDPYGRQIERETSQVWQHDQTAPGRYWRTKA